MRTWRKPQQTHTHKHTNEPTPSQMIIITNELYKMRVVIHPLSGLWLNALRPPLMLLCFWMAYTNVGV